MKRGCLLKSNEIRYPALIPLRIEEKGLQRTTGMLGMI